MNDFYLVIVLSLLPAIGNISGGLLASHMPMNRGIISIALHHAAGVVLAIVGVEIMPMALQVGEPWLIIVMFVVGGIVFIAIDDIIGTVNAVFRNGTGSRRPWAIYLGVAMDLFTDGIMIGAAATIDPKLGILFALGQVTADIPEGFATMSVFKSVVCSKSKCNLILLTMSLPSVLGAVIGYLLLRGRSEIMQLSILAFTAGVLVTLVVEEMAPEAHKDKKEPRYAGLATLLGFAVFSFLALYVL